MKNVVGFGDSVLKGIVFNNDNSESRYELTDMSFTNICTERLGINLENFARFGNTITHALSEITRRLPAIDGSDYVILKYGGNDSDFPWKTIADNPDRNIRPNTPLDIFYERYREVVRMLKARGKTPVLLSILPLEPDLYLDYVSRDFSQDQKANVMNWLGGQTKCIINYHEMYNLEIMKLARREGVRLIDITSPFLEKRDLREYMCPDGIHPNEKGHQLIAEAICNAVNEEIPELKPRCISNFRGASFCFD